jgi:glutamate dehydrogenase/leucine dehydrogenase
MADTFTPFSADNSTISWRGFREYSNHEFLMGLSDDISGLKAYVGIHNTNLGPALGGTRFKQYASEEEAMHDVLNLSKAMSYKCALANLPYGGGKAVIIAEPQLDRNEVLAAYSRLVDKLGGMFKTGTDVGVSDDDVRHMGQFTSHMLGLTEADRGTLTTSGVAALGVFYAIQSALNHLYGNPSFEGKTVAIKGAGKLGGELARLVIEAGGQVFVSDVDEAKCRSLEENLQGVTTVSNDSIHTQDVDVYAPCALGGEFTTHTIGHLKCKAVAGGANNQLSDDSAGDQLHERGILYVPDYVANAGGLIYVADELEQDGFNQQRVLDRARHIGDTVTDILNRAKEQGMPTYKVADILALERITKGNG